MNIIEIINKKRLKMELTKEELDYAFTNYMSGAIKDYQMSSLLMAICINGMTLEEIFILTDLFLHSGDILDLSSVPGVKVDKHSTGGVGDKTTLVIGPIVASCGLFVPKMSGRALGHTGGTIDKLESIEGFNVNLTLNQFIDQVNKIGFALTSQTPNLTPMDKKIYALRDVTGTTESIPLIASSIMSKKIAGGADKILIDIKVGKGALIKTKEDAIKLSNIMIEIGKKYNKEVRTIMTDMNNPLGTSIGNSLEVLEAIHILQGKEEGSFKNLCIELASNMVSMGKNISIEEAKEEVIEVLNNKDAYRKFIEFVEMQNGDITKLKFSNNCVDILSKKDGIIMSIDAQEIGKISMDLGAGRKEITDTIDHKVGIVLRKKVGDKVLKNDILCTIYLGDKPLEKDVESFFVIE